MRAEATVPMISAPYEPEKTKATKTSSNASIDASACLALSNFHLMIAILKNTAIPTIRYSIVLLFIIDLSEPTIGGLC